MIGSIIGWIGDLLGISSLIARYFQRRQDIQTGTTDQVVVDQKATIHETTEANQVAASVKSMSDQQLDDSLRADETGSHR